MRKLFIILSVCLMTVLPANAVLKEKDLGQTLSVLKNELAVLHKEQLQRMARFESMNKRFDTQMISVLKKSDQIALMLYSQKTDFIFDLTYACNEATSQYNDFSTNMLPFEKFVHKANKSIIQYNNLVKSLNKIPEFTLENDEQRADRKECLILAAEIAKDVVVQRDKLKNTQQKYKMVLAKLKELNDYAIVTYDDIRQSIFVNGDKSYFNVISQWGRYWKSSQQDLTEKYTLSRSTRSEWRGNLVIMLFIFIVFYAVITGSISFSVIRWLIPKRFETAEFMEKRSCIIIASTVITFSIVLMVGATFFITHNFFIMAAGLLAEYSWLLGAIMLSLIIRLNGENVKSGVRLYIPVSVIGFIVFTFRITFMPNTVVNLIFPILLLICTLWQWNVISRHNKNVPRSDTFYTWISLLAMVSALIMSWSGYTLMSVQVLIWWIIQLTAIQTITVVYDLLASYEKKHIGVNADIRHTWFYDSIYKMIVPILGVYSLMGSIFWAAKVFDLTEWCIDLFSTNFVNIPGIVVFSLYRLSVVVSLWFVFHYLIYVVKSYYILWKTKKAKSGKAAVSLFINILRYVGWGIYLFIILVILDVNRSGITLILTGLSTGIGFAMKDTLENLFYGISLMTGRVKIGDVIECDGMRGKVTNINYQSTLIETLDGSVMAFLNSQLFSKNFKNMTRNHGYELAKLSVGVAYGSKVENVRKIIIDRLTTLDCYQKSKGISVLFDNFGDSSVDLSVVIWVPVASKLVAVARIKEEIYDVLNENNIEIPFPQQDLHVRKELIESLTK